MSDHVAKEDIPFGDPGRGVFAFRRGDRVPADLVESNKWHGYVVGANTKEARQIHAELTGEPVDQGTSAGGASASKSSEQKG